MVGGIGFHAVLEQLDIPVGQAPDAPVHFGGPVEIRRGFVIHSADWTGRTRSTSPGRWRLSSTIDILRAIAEGTGPAHWVCALGYAGWSAGQLDEELTSAGWFTAPGDPELIWSTPPPTAGPGAMRGRESIRGCWWRGRAMPDPAFRLGGRDIKISLYLIR